MTPQQIELSDAIFCMRDRLTSKGIDPILVNRIAMSACHIAGVAYPPVKKESE